MTEISGKLDVDGAAIAWRKLEGRGPTVVWMGGFRSDMGGTKAQALADWAATTGRAFLRFDYFAHGESDGDFGEATITRWRGDSLAVLDQLTEGPLVLIGSSMGGWLACLVAAVRAERLGRYRRDRPLAAALGLWRRALSDYAQAAGGRRPLVDSAGPRADRGAGAGAAGAGRSRCPLGPCAGAVQRPEQPRCGVSSDR